jgi:hypothetical protein
VPRVALPPEAVPTYNLKKAEEREAAGLAPHCLLPGVVTMITRVDSGR